MHSTLNRVIDMSRKWLATGSNAAPNSSTVATSIPQTITDLTLPPLPHLSNPLSYYLSISLLILETIFLFNNSIAGLDLMVNHGVLPAKVTCPNARELATFTKNSRFGGVTPHMWSQSYPLLDNQSSQPPPADSREPSKDG